MRVSELASTLRSIPLAALLVLHAGCLSQSYEISAPELRRLVELAPERRGERVRATQQTAFGNDASDVSPDLDDAGWAMLIASDTHDEHQHHRHGRRVLLDDADDGVEDDDDSAEAALATAVVVVAAAATAAVTIGATEGARFDGWVRARPDQPVLLVEPSGERHWSRLALLEPEQVQSADRAVLPDLGGDLQHLERSPLDRVGFAYQLELGAEPAPFEGGSLAVAGRGAVGYMPDQHYGILLGAAFSSASSDAGYAATPTSAYLSFDHRLFVQAEAWPLASGRWHLGPYGELGYAWARADDALGTRATEGWMLGLGAALQLDWTTRLALTLRAGAAWLPSVEAGSALAVADHRLAPALTLGVSIY